MVDTVTFFGFEIFLFLEMHQMFTLHHTIEWRPTWQKLWARLLIFLRFRWLKANWMTVFTTARSLIWARYCFHFFDNTVFCHTGHQQAKVWSQREVGSGTVSSSNVSWHYNTAAPPFARPTRKLKITVRLCDPTLSTLKMVRQFRNVVDWCSAHYHNHHVANLLNDTSKNPNILQMCPKV